MDDAARRGQSSARTTAGTLLVLIADLGAFTLILMIGLIFLFSQHDLKFYEIIGAIVLIATVEPNALINSPTFHVARAVAYNIVNVYAIKMAGVFMISASTVALYTAFAPRWMALLGYMWRWPCCSAATT